MINKFSNFLKQNETPFIFIASRFYQIEQVISNITLFIYFCATEEYLQLYSVFAMLFGFRALTKMALNCVISPTDRTLKGNAFCEKGEIMHLMEQM